MSTFATVMSNKTLNILLSLLTVFGATLVLFSSCDDEETYADQKKHERSTITNFIQKGATVVESTTGDTILHVEPITVINEEQFAAQDSTTDVSKNEYVLLSKTGIYMQIIRKGSGEKLASGETETVLVRYLEYNLAGDSIQTRNNSLYYVAVPDELTCSNSYGSYTGSFISGVMKSFYSTSVVPNGWLYPLAYINLGRQTSDNENIAKIRIIVPHSAGHSSSSTSVYACFYEMTYQKGRA